VGLLFVGATTAATITTDMEVEVHPGKYVLAVSGGVDSMVLLDLLSKEQDSEIVCQP